MNSLFRLFVQTVLLSLEYTIPQQPWVPDGFLTSKKSLMTTATTKKADYTSITKDYLKSETPWAIVCIFPNKLDGAAPPCFLWVCLDGSLLLQMM